MKKQIFLFVMGLAIFGITNAASGDNSKTSTASERAQKSFHKAYKNATNETWYTLQGGFKVEFTKDGHQTSSVYGKRGNWLYTIEYFRADALEKDLIDIVKTEYDKYYIAAVEKVETSAADPVYVVHLENGNSYKTLRVHKTDIELVQDFKKG